MIWMRLKSELRQSWRGMLVLVLITALFGGVVFAITGPRLSSRTGHSGSMPGSQRQRRGKGGGGSFTSRMEDRFRRRFDD